MDRFYGLFYTGGKIAFTPDGKELAFASGNKISKIDILRKKVEPLTFYLRSIVLSLDIERRGNFMIVIDSTNLMVLIDLKKKEIRGKCILRNNGILLKWSPRGKYFAAVIKNDIQVWKPNLNSSNGHSSFQLSRTYNGSYGPIWDIDWDQTGDFLISGGQDKIVRIFSFRKKKNFFEINVKEFQEEIFFVKFLKNFDYFLVLTKDNSLTTWSFLPNTPKSVLTWGGEKLKVKMLTKSKIWVEKKLVSAVFLNLNSNTMFIGQMNGKVCAFDISVFLSEETQKRKKLLPLKPKILFSIETGYSLDSSISSISGSSNSGLIAIGKFKNGKIIVFDQISNKVLFFYGNSKNHFTCFDIAHNNRVVCTGNRKGSMNIWSKISGFCLVKFFNHIREINKVIFLRNNSRIIISSSSDGTLKVFDLQKGVIIRTLFSVGSQKNFDMISPDDSGFFIAGSCKKTFLICIWSIKNGTLIESLQGHTSPIRALSFLKNRISLISGSLDKTLRIWNLENLMSNKTCSCDFFNVYEKITKIVIHPKKYEIVILSKSGFFYFFNFRELSWATCFFKTTNTNFKKKKFASIKVSISSICYSFDGTFFIFTISSRFLRFFHRLSLKSAGFIVIPKIKFFPELSRFNRKNTFFSTKKTKIESNDSTILDLKSTKTSNNFLVLFEFCFFFFTVSKFNGACKRNLLFRRDDGGKKFMGTNFGMGGLEKRRRDCDEYYEFFFYIFFK